MKKENSRGYSRASGGDMHPEVGGRLLEQVCSVRKAESDAASGL
jgi:hypothetical protein